MQKFEYCSQIIFDGSCIRAKSHMALLGEIILAS